MLYELKKRILIERDLIDIISPPFCRTYNIRKASGSFDFFILCFDVNLLLTCRLAVPVTKLYIFDVVHFVNTQRPIEILKAKMYLDSQLQTLQRLLSRSTFLN